MDSIFHSDLYRAYQQALAEKLGENVRDEPSSTRHYTTTQVKQHSTIPRENGVMTEPRSSSFFWQHDGQLNKSLPVLRPSPCGPLPVKPRLINPALLNDNQIDRGEEISLDHPDTFEMIDDVCSRLDFLCEEHPLMGDFLHQELASELVRLPVEPHDSDYPGFAAPASHVQDTQSAIDQALADEFLSVEPNYSFSAQPVAPVVSMNHPHAVADEIPSLVSIGNYDYEKSHELVEGFLAVERAFFK